MPFMAQDPSVAARFHSQAGTPDCHERDNISRRAQISSANPGDETDKRHESRSWPVVCGNYPPSDGLRLDHCTPTTPTRSRSREWGG